MGTAERRLSPGAGFVLALILSTVLWALLLVAAAAWLFKPSPAEAAEWYRSLQPPLAHHPAEGALGRPTCGAGAGRPTDTAGPGVALPADLRRAGAA